MDRPSPPANASRWGSKRCASLSCSDGLWEKLTSLAAANACSRSEVLEVLVRVAHSEELDILALRDELLAG